MDQTLQAALKTANDNRDVIKAKREAKRDQNREQMPIVAQFVDEMRELFGEVKVKWCSENGKTIGKPSRDA